MHDLEGGAELEVRARVVVNATGIWTTEIERLAGVDVPAAGAALEGRAHRRAAATASTRSYALILPTEKSVLFVLPWGRHWIIGTTDTDWSFGLDHPAATRADIDYLLEHVNAVLARPLTFDDVTGVYVGLRPLVAARRRPTRPRSRASTRCGAARRGFVSVAGGKYTTYRLMARDAVDVAARDLPFAVDASRTADMPLLGAVGRRRTPLGGRGPPRAPPASRRRSSTIWSGATARSPLEVLDLVVDDPRWPRRWPAPTSTWRPRSATRRSHEAALHVDDVLTRRTHIAFEAAGPRPPAPSKTSRGSWRPCLGWDEEAVAREVAHYRARLDAESAESMPDDAASDAARAPVRDLRLRTFPGEPGGTLRTATRRV